MEQTENERLAAALAATAKVPPSQLPASARAAQAQAETHSHQDSPREYLRFMLAYRKAAEALGVSGVSRVDQHVATVEASEPLPFQLLIAAQEFCSPEEDEESGEARARASTHGTVLRFKNLWQAESMDGGR